MSFPVQLLDGTIVQIVKKLENKNLLGEDGKQYRRTSNPLRHELVEEYAPAAVEPEVEPVEEVADFYVEISIPEDTLTATEENAEAEWEEGLGA